MTDLERTLHREIEAWKRLVRKLGKRTTNNEILFGRGQRRPFWRDHLETRIGVPIPDSYVALLTAADGFRIFLLNSENRGVQASLLGLQGLINFGALDAFPGDEATVFVPVYSREICWGFRGRQGLREVDPPMYRQDSSGNYEPDPGGTLAEVLADERKIFAEDFAGLFGT